MSRYAERCALLAATCLAAVALVPGAARADLTYVGATAHATVNDQDAFTFGSPVGTTVLGSGSYAGIATQVTALDNAGSNYLGSQAAILAGRNTGGEATVSMAWRNRTTFETDGRGYGGVYFPSVGFAQYTVPTGGTAGRGLALAFDSYDVASDVVNLQGVTGVYTLQMHYNAAALILDNPTMIDVDVDRYNDIYLGWLRTDGGGLPGYDTWVNAVDGNRLTGDDGTKAVAWYKGTYDQFFLEHSDLNDATLNQYLGSFGCDTTTDTVWAVLDHNSQFGVVPEPSTLSLLALGLPALLARRRRQPAATSSGPGTGPANPKL
jgi:hypothetical protein